MKNDAASESSTTSPNPNQKEFSASRTQAIVNGEPTVELYAPLKDSSRPQITRVEVLPGRGMNLFRVRAHLPERGEVDLFHARALKSGNNTLGDPEKDFNGNLSFSEGGAILVPFANRIRGQLSADGTEISTTIAGHNLRLPANWSGKKPGAEKNAMHGLILDAKIGELRLESGDSSAEVRGELNAGDFGGHWVSRTRLDFFIHLDQQRLLLEVKATNVGEQNLPIGIGWHPYFTFPSGKREQARLKIPASARLLVDNYDDVFPTGEKEAVEGTPYDFTAANGSALGSLYMDDCFVDLERSPDDSTVSAEIVDPLARYGMRVEALSREIKAFQVYAPPNENFVALEPQFNLADPFNEKIWGSATDTGMVMLPPGQSASYRVALSLFTPSV